MDRRMNDYVVLPLMHLFDDNDNDDDHPFF